VRGGSTHLCPGSGACLAGACDEALDACVVVPSNEGGSCDDGDACTGQGKCAGGMCVPGPAVDCSFLDGVCTVGVCQPGIGCVGVPANDGAACNDGLFCTVGESCLGGMCVGGAPNPCAQPGGCFVGVCNEAADSCVLTPGNDGLPCDDGDVCTQGTTCLAGQCAFGSPANEGAACDDGSACTTGDVCAAGKCTGTNGAKAYFADDFSDNAAGWTLGPEWEIGPAKLSFGGTIGADPDVDHSPTNDNGVAGVVIGGNTTIELHSAYYLLSPSFSTLGAGPVILGYYRWLNSDYDPFMHSTVEVFDGAAWHLIWSSGPAPGVFDSPPNGTGWTYVQHDITAFRSGATRVRFGVDVTSQGAYTVGSWNLDDLLVADAACP
jgi:hypothetical protein